MEMDDERGRVGRGGGKHMIDVNALRENVERGAAMLDGNRPGWWKRINLERLMLEDCHRCVLGQLTGDYGSGEADLLVGWIPPYACGRYDVMVSFGFQAAAWQSEDIAIWRGVWCEVILARRKNEQSKRGDELRCKRNPMREELATTEPSSRRPFAAVARPATSRRRRALQLT